MAQQELKKGKWNIIVRSLGNEFDLLQDAIYSILAQTYEDKSILLTIHSDDEKKIKATREFLKRFEDLIEIKILELRDMKAKRGVPFNIALDASDGEFISVLDHDDVYYPHMGEILIETLKKHNANFVYGNSVVTSQVLVTSNWGEQYLYKTMKNKVFGQKFTKLRYVMENYIPINVILYSREFIGDTRFDTNLDRVEDWEFNFSLMEKEEFKPYYLDMNVSEYRISNDGSDSYLHNEESEKLWNDSRAYVRKKHKDTVLSIKVDDISKLALEYFGFQKENALLRHELHSYTNSVSFKVDKRLENYKLINKFASFGMKIILIPYRLLRKIKHKF